MFFSESLPVNVIRNAELRLALALNASMLVEDQSTKRLNPGGNPDAKVGSVGKFARGT